MDNAARPTTRTPLAVAALLALIAAGPGAVAQTTVQGPMPAPVALAGPSPVAAAGPGPGPHGLVVVNGVRQAPGEQYLIDPTTDILLSGQSAISCAFLSPYRAAYDPVMVDYLQHFAPGDSLSRDIIPFTEYAPLGDVSTYRDPSILDGIVPRHGPWTASEIGCSAADLRFAAGRAHIRRKDKSLAQAFEAFDRKDYATAQSQFNLAWNKIGYLEAALMLGQMHLYGLGMPPDGRQAVYWLDRVAGARFDPRLDRMRFNPAHPERMSPYAQAAILLARMHERGIGIPADPAAARKWYRKAADVGYVPALDVLARDFMHGSLGPKDEAKGLAYLKEAAEAGYAPSRYRLGKLYYAGEGGVPRDLNQAGAWFEAAAKAGHPAALFAAGRMLDMGEGVPADSGKAIVYYKDAALRGDRDAEFALGTYFYHGEVVPKDVRTARGWFDAAARQGQPDAMYNMGAMLSQGEGGPADMAMAYVWLSLASSAGHERANAALQTVAPRLSPQDRNRADAVLRPKS